MDVAAVKRTLSSENVRSNYVLARRILHQLLQQGCLSELLPVTLTYLSSYDPVCKKLAYWLLQSQLTTSDSSDGFLLAANTFSKDCVQANPASRAIAIKALSWGGAWSPDLSAQAVQGGIKDVHPQVRRAAVVALKRLLHDEALTKELTAEMLYQQIRDTDQIVRCLSLQVVDDILQQEGGVVISKSMAVHLLRGIHDVPEWLLASLLTALSNFIPPPDSDLRFEMMNCLDPFLQSPSPSICLCTLEYFLKLAPEFKSQVLDRATRPVVQFIGSHCPEITACVLDKISEIYIESDVEYLRPFHQSFRCKKVDPWYVKAKKIRVLGYLTDRHTIDGVLHDLKDLATNHSELNDAVLTTCAVIGRDKEMKHKVVKTLISLLALKRTVLTGDLLCSLHKLGISFELMQKQRELLQSSIEMVLNQSDADTNNMLASLQAREPSNNLKSLTRHTKAALSLLGDWNTLPNRVYKLKEYVETFTRWNNTDLADALLLASLKIFLCQPAQGQGLLGVTLEHCLKQGSAQSKHRAKLYYSMLQQDVEKTRSIIFSSQDSSHELSCTTH